MQRHARRTCSSSSSSRAAGSLVGRPVGVPAAAAPRPQQHQQHQRPLVSRRRAAAQTETSATTPSTQRQSTASTDDEGSTPPPGCSRYSISIKKPLGLVLEQNATGVITVAEISPEGSAAKTGLVAVGDQLIAVSGVTYSKESDYGGVAVKQGQQVVRMTVQGQSFKTVRAAIGSHPGHMEVKLEFQRC